MWLALIFIFLGIFARIIPHIPNFAPVAAVALFSGLYWNKKYGFLIPLGVYMLSDFIIGLHDVVFFTWSSVLLIYFLGLNLRKHKTFSSMLLYTVFSSILFFMVTNFGVWLAGWYPPNLHGLAACYIYALPFFRISLLSNLAYMLLFCSAYEYFLSRMRLTQRAV